MSSQNFIDQLDQKPLENWEKYTERVGELAKNQTVNDLKQVLT